MYDPAEDFAEFFRAIHPMGARPGCSVPNCQCPAEFYVDVNCRDYLTNTHSSSAHPVLPYLCEMHHRGMTLGPVKRGNWDARGEPEIDRPFSGPVGWFVEYFRIWAPPFDAAAHDLRRRIAYLRLKAVWCASLQGWRAGGQPRPTASDIVPTLSASVEPGPQSCGGERQSHEVNDPAGSFSRKALMRAANMRWCPPVCGDLLCRAPGCRRAATYVIFVYHRTAGTVGYRIELHREFPQLCEVHGREKALGPEEPAFVPPEWGQTYSFVQSQLLVEATAAAVLAAEARIRTASEHLAVLEGARR